MLSIYLVSLASLAVLVLLLFIGARRKAKYFLLFTVVLLLWLLPQFLCQFVFYKDQDISDMLLRISLGVAGFVIPSLTLFVRHLLHGRRLLMLQILGYASPLAGLLAACSDLTVQASVSGIVVSSSQPFYPILIYSVFAGFIIAILTLRRHEHASTETKKERQGIYYLRQSLLFSTSLNIVGAMIFPKSEWSQILTPLSMAILALLIYISIFKHQLFNIRLFIARTLAYAALISTFVGLYFIGLFVFADRIFTADTMFSTRILPVLIALLLVFTTPTLKRFFDKLTNRLFYRDAYDPEVFLDQLNKTLVGNIEIGILLRHTVAVIEQNLKADCFLYIRETDSTPRRIAGTYKKEFTDSDLRQLRTELLTIPQKTVITDELEEHYDELRNTLESNDIAIVVSMLTDYASSSEATSYLLLGPKKSGNSYSKQDIRIINIITDELLIAIQNALRFEEIQSFNITLQNRINDATAKLKRSNEKLREMDETKDEFISMASHQLRTPLTSVKGYLSMVLDGDAGKVTETQQQLLNQAYVSSQRMVYLIADLLNVSRLKTGKFIINASPTNLADMVESEIAQLTEVAKSRKLTLTFNKPKDFPVLDLDETKTRQVVMNFVDNAIYYTPSGGKIKIELNADRSSVYFMVKDNGMGVPKAEQQHLFSKFYRAKNAQKARPDGTGLGLFMAKKVITDQGGTILFESNEGKGSTFGFKFDLPK